MPARLEIQVVAELRKAVTDLKALSGQMKHVVKATQEASVAFKRLHGFTGMITEAFGRLRSFLGPMAAGFLAMRAIGAVGEFLREGAEAAAQEEVAIRGLHQVLVSMGRYSPELERRLVTLASALELQTAYGNEAILTAAKFLATYREISDEVLPRALQVTLDIARGWGVSLKTAANMVGKAAMGLTGELRRYGISVDRATYETRGFIGVLEEIERQVRGQAKAYTETASGIRELVRVTASDVAKQFGYVVEGGLEPFREAFARAFAWVSEDLRRIRTEKLASDLRRAREEADRLAHGLARAWMGLYRLTKEAVGTFWRVRYLIPVLGPTLMQIEALGARGAEALRRSQEDLRGQIQAMEELRAKRAALAQAEEELERLEQQRTEAARKGTQERLRLLESERQALEAQRKTILQSLQEAERQYEQYGQKILDIEARVTQVRQEAARQIADIRRRGMPPEEVEADRLRELRRLYEDYWAAVDPGQKERLARAIMDGAQALKDEQDAIRWIREGEQLLIWALEEQKAKAEEAKEAEARRLEKQKRKLEEVEKKLKGYNDQIKQLKEELTELSQQKTVAEIDADISQARAKIEELRRQIQRLEEITIRVKVEAKGKGGPVGFQAGGLVPGYGSGDRVPALLEPGEFVLRKEVVRALGLGFLERLNSRLTSLRAPSMPQRAPEKWGSLFQGTGKVFTLVVGGERIQAVTDAEMLKRLERAFERQRLVGANR